MKPIKQTILAAVTIASACSLARAAPPACPSVASLSEEWVEHSGATPPDPAFQRHGVTPLKMAAPLLLPVRTVPYWIGVVHRSPAPAESPNPGCQVLGSAAFYANGSDNAPTDDIVAVARSGREPGLRPRLIELRWFDEKDGKRHRWFDAEAARDMGAEDGASPLPPAQAVNSLL